MHIWFSWESQKGGDEQEDIDVGRIILKWILEKKNVVVWTRFIWLMIGTSGGLLSRR
jgi:hypothetical protein